MILNTDLLGSTLLHDREIMSHIKEKEKRVIEQVEEKVPQSNFRSIVIFNFAYVFFYGIYCHFIEISLFSWVSAEKKTLSWSQKRFKKTLFVTNQWFLCSTDSVKQRNHWFVTRKETWSKFKIIVLRTLDLSTLEEQMCKLFSTDRCCHFHIMYLKSGLIPGMYLKMGKMVIFLHYILQEEEDLNLLQILKAQIKYPIKNIGTVKYNMPLSS